MFIFRILLAASLTLVAACSGPFLVFAGGALQGPEQPYSPAVVPAQDTLVQLETRPDDPYSVNLNAFVVAGNLYLDPTAERAWYEHITQDNRIRLRIDGFDVVYSARAVEVTDPAIKARFDADRIPLRIQAR